MRKQLDILGGLTVLFSQDFGDPTPESSIVVTHNTGILYTKVRVMVGNKVRSDLIDSLVATPEDARNELTVNLLSAQTGTIEILASSLPSVNTPTPEESTALTRLTMGNLPPGNPKRPKIHRHTDEPKDHREINYKSGLKKRLHKKVTDEFRGEIREVTYYEDDTESDEILRANMAYTRDVETGLALSRQTTRTWKNEDETDNDDTKVTNKKYSHDSREQMREGRRRRNNVVDKLSIDVLGLLAMFETSGDLAAAEAIGVPYMASHDSALNNYVRTGDQQIVTDVGNDSTVEPDGYPWLTHDIGGGVTIQQYIQAAFTPIQS